MAIKKKPTQAFSTKEFHVFFPFDTKDVACPECGTLPCTCEEESGKVIQIKGFANFCGNLDDEASVFVDHTGDVMVPGGFDLSTWNKNPQILWQHDRAYTIGKGISAVKQKDGLVITAEIHEKAMKEQDFYKIEQGLVTMFSVGFRTLKGEYKEVNGKEVFYITKALLYEVSCVGIPANSESQFTRIKSLEDGSFSTEDFTPQSAASTVGASYKQTHKDNIMQIKLREMLPADKVKELEDLGLGESLDELKDVDTKAYIAAVVEKNVAAAVSAAMETLKADITKADEVVAEAKEDEEKPAESTEDSSAEVEVEEVKEEESVETKEAVKSLVDAFAQFKALATAE